MCGSMVDIQSATAEIRRGKKGRRKETGQKYNVRICYAGGHNDYCYCGYWHWRTASVNATPRCSESVIGSRKDAVQRASFGISDLVFLQWSWHCCLSDWTVMQPVECLHLLFMKIHFKEPAAGPT